MAREAKLVSHSYGNEPTAPGEAYFRVIGGMGLFITFEGPEGSGKTTQLRLLAGWLAEQGHNVLLTREPGGTRIGNKVRELLLDPSHTEMCAEAEILLFSAARAQIVGEVIRPHLARGGVVLCDRFADSTLAYQGFGRQLNLETLRLITAFATGNLTPDLTFCFDLPVAVGLAAQADGRSGRVESYGAREARISRAGAPGLLGAGGRGASALASRGCVGAGGRSPGLSPRAGDGPPGADRSTTTLGQARRSPPIPCLAP